MLASSLTLDDFFGNNVIFNEISSKELGVRLRKQSGTTTNEPGLLKIAHTTQGSGLYLIDRHLVSYEIARIGTDGKLHKATVNLTMALDRNPIVTLSDIKLGVGVVGSLIFTGGFNSTTGAAAPTNLEDIMDGGA